MKYKLLCLVFLSLIVFQVYGCSTYDTNNDIYAYKITFSLYDDDGKLLEDDQIQNYDKTLIVVIFFKYDTTDAANHSNFYDTNNAHYAELLGITDKSNFLISSTDQTVWYSYNSYSASAYKEMLSYASHDFVDEILVQNDSST